MLFRFWVLCVFFSLGFPLLGSLQREWSHLSDSSDKEYPAFLWQSLSGILGEVIETEKLDLTRSFTFRHYSTQGWKLWKKVNDENFIGEVLLREKDDSGKVFFVTGLRNCIDCEKSLRAYTCFGIKLFETQFKGRAVGLKTQGGKVFLAGETSTHFFGKAFKSLSGELLWSHETKRGKEARAFDVGPDEVIYLAGKSQELLPKIFLVRMGTGLLQADIISENDRPNFSEEKIESLRVRKNLDIFFLTKEFPGTMNGSLNIILFNQDLERQWKKKVARTGGPSQALWTEFFLAKGKHPTLVGSIRDFYNVNPTRETKRAFLTQINGDSGDLIFKSTPNDENYTKQEIYETFKRMKTDAFGDFFILSEDQNLLGVTKVHGETGERLWFETLGNLSEFRVKDFLVQGNQRLVFTIQSKNETLDSLIVSYSQD